MGRPSSYTDAKADMICEAIAQGKAVYLEAEQNPDWPHEATIYRWLEDNASFREKYARARERSADRNADEILHIADTATDANIARLQVDARKWRASKFAPKKYGDKIDVSHSGSIATMNEVQIDTRIAELLRKAGVDATPGTSGSDRGGDET